MSYNDEPLPTVFSTTIPVRISDINYGNHVGHDALISIIHEARMQYLAHHGFTELNVCGKGTLITEFSIKYKKEIKYGEVLTVRMVATSFSKTSFELQYDVSTKNSAAAFASSTSTFYDYKAEKVCRIPKEFKEILEDEIANTVD